MAIEITLSLPESLIERAKNFGGATYRDVEAVLADTLEMMWPTLGRLPNCDYPAVSSLTDAEVLSLAEAKMDPVQNDRLGALQKKESLILLLLMSGMNYLRSCKFISLDNFVNQKLLLKLFNVDCGSLWLNDRPFENQS